MRFSSRSWSGMLLLCLILLFVTSCPITSGQSIKIDNPDFQKIWNRTDSLVTGGQAQRTYLWGPAPFTDAILEPYLDSPGGKRLVQYFDKSRMEITNPNGDKANDYFVTNGLLVQQLMTGRLQLGDKKFENRPPSSTGVAGDSDDTSGPTYQVLGKLTGTASKSEGKPVAQAVDRAGKLRDATQDFGQYGVSYAYFEPSTSHNIAKPFWDFLNVTGPVLGPDGQVATGRLFEPVFYATGLPVTEAYWSKVKLNGQIKDVLVQAFERRVLTYTPSNSNGFQVEMGNVGRHYKQWLDYPPTPPASIEIRNLKLASSNYEMKLTVNSDVPTSIKEILVQVKDTENNTTVYSSDPVPFDPAKDTTLIIPVKPFTPGRKYTINLSANDVYNKLVTSKAQPDSTVLGTDNILYPAPTPATVFFDNSPQLDTAGKNYIVTFTINSSAPENIEKILIDVIDEKGQSITPALAPLGYNPQSKTVQVPIPTERLQPNKRYKIEIKAKNKDQSFILTPNSSNILGTTDFSYSEAAPPKPVTIKVVQIFPQKKDTLGNLVLPIRVVVQDDDKQLDQFKGFVKCRVGIQANSVNILQLDPKCENDTRNNSEWPIDIPLQADQLKENQEYNITVDLVTPSNSKLSNISVSQPFKPTLLPPPGFWDGFIVPNRLIFISLFLALIILAGIIAFRRIRPRKKAVLAPRPYSEATMVHMKVPMMVPVPESTMVHEPVARPKLRLRLKVVQTPDPSQMRQEIITTFPLVIGRNNNRVVITGDPKISGSHVEIREEGDSLTLLDLNSTNGTIVGNQKLDKGGKINFKKRIVVSLGPNTVIELDPEK